MRAEPLGLRLFLEGIEVPVISAQVTIAPSQPATAAIQIVPTDAALTFFPRTLVHLFFLDMSEEDGKVAYYLEAKEKSTAGEVNRFDAPETKYKLLFAGEVIGWQFNKTPQGRNLVLQCMDLSSYWDTCYQWFADFSVNGNALTDKSHAFVAAGENLFDNVAGGHTWVTGMILEKPPRSPGYQTCKGLLGGVISLIETIGGIRPQSATYRGYRGTSDFFSIAELRYNLVGMLGALAKDTTSVKLYNMKAFYAWLQSGMTSLGNLLSYRDILRQVCSYIFHDIYPNPSAYYIPEKSDMVRYESNLVGNDDAVESLVQLAQDKLVSARTSIVSIIASSSSDLAEEEIALVSVRDNITGAVELLSSASSKSKIKAASAKLENIRVKTDGLIDESLVLTTLAATEHPAELDRLATELDSVIKDLNSVVKKTENFSDKFTGSHLFNQLLLPEIFFLPPPRCNVLFPDQYTELSFTRNFMREVTRLSCAAGLGFITGGKGNDILGSRYYAPQVEDYQGNTLGEALAKGAHVLLPHEVHAGIIPKFEWVTDGHRFTAQANRDKTGGSALEANTSYVQRLATFQFFLHRWSARSITFTAKFNPRLVIGFPALIINQSAPAIAALKEIEKVLDKPFLPTQFVGKLAQLTHTVSQQGGLTHGAMVYCRTHRGLDDEYVGALNKKKSASASHTVKVRSVLNTHGPRLDINILKAIIPSLLLATEKPETPTVNVSRDLASPNNKVTLKDQDVRGPFDVNSSKANKKIFAYTMQRPATGNASQQVRRYFSALAKLKLAVPGLGTVTSAKFTGIFTTDGTTLESVGVDISKVPENIILGEYDVFSPDDVSSKDPTIKHMYLPETITVTYGVEVDVGRSTEPFEKIMMPSYYNAIWNTYPLDAEGKSPLTKDVYEFLLGVGSVSDDSAYLADLVKESKMYEDFKFEGPNLEQAIDGLSMEYGIVKEHGNDVHEFIQRYTFRPIANLPQVMGSLDYELKPDGTHTGTEGFHSRAFGDYNVGVVREFGKEPKVGPLALHGLLPIVGGKMIHARKSRLNDKIADDIPAHLDPRGEARQRVRAYMAELNFSRGLKGS